MDFVPKRQTYQLDLLRRPESWIFPAYTEKPSPHGNPTRLNVRCAINICMVCQNVGMYPLSNRYRTALGCGATNSNKARATYRLVIVGGMDSFSVLDTKPFTQCRSILYEKHHFWHRIEGNSLRRRPRNLTMPASAIDSVAVTTDVCLISSIISTSNLCSARFYNTKSYTFSHLILFRNSHCKRYRPRTITATRQSPLTATENPGHGICKLALRMR